MQHELEDVMAAYAAAWIEGEDGKRLDLLEACWSADGHYIDPNIHTVGRQELSGYIGRFLAHSPGARIEITSGASQHHARIYFKWQMVTGAGGVAIEGVDFGRLAEDGRIEEITGFFGAPPALSG